MRPVRTITAEENCRIERRGAFDVIKRDSVEPEPVGTIVLKAFRIVGYDRDCDGSLMGRYEHIDKHGEATGWEPRNVGVNEGCDIVCTLDEWRSLFS
jgi:hypothetical protein